MTLAKFEKYQHVIELSVRVCDDGRDYYRYAAGQWLRQHVGEDGDKWEDLPVRYEACITVGFTYASDKRKFALWSELQGVSCTDATTIQLKNGFEKGYTKYQVNQNKDYKDQQ